MKSMKINKNVSSQLLVGKKSGIINLRKLDDEFALLNLNSGKKMLFLI